MLLPIVPGNGHDGQIPFGARVAFLFKECTVVRNPPAPLVANFRLTMSFLFVKWEAQKNAQRNL
jgi:hypothetical protein